MPTRLTDSAVTREPSITVGRPPQQGRSRASLERMMDAAEALLVERGCDDFALTDVSRVGRISIGSIYNRFTSKNELVQVVHARSMDRLEAEQTLILMRARSRSSTPAMLVRAIIDELGQFLARHSHIMRPMMLCAAFDSVVQNRGRLTHDRMIDAITIELLTQRAAIRQPDPERAVRAVLRIAYAAFARELGFGRAEAPPDGADWTQLRVDMGDMAAAFLLDDEEKR
jgi:AcrR family transcriptional regulator